MVKWEIGCITRDLGEYMTVPTEDRSHIYHLFISDKIFSLLMTLPLQKN